ncbi:hypothetical protein C1Y40_03306 [Mycobacterium talmoniae]|uniref:Uncharacterized protein n=1 Tax=Mycobacterium talmoniae TaxID=1858794 RepID=A0A2S8BIR7_9MYCO|nr:hypothetical protein C1Y40_03306 [Mycobacterium talmoniae]
MIRHRDRRNTSVHSTFGVVDAHHAFQHERSAPQLTQPGDVLPGRRRGPHPFAVGVKERRPGFAAAALVGHPQLRWAQMFAPAPQVARFGEHFRGHPQHGAQVHLLGDLGAAPVAPVREGPVGGGDQPDRPGRAGPLHPLGDRVATAQPVDLEEHLGVGVDDVLDRLTGERGQPHGGAAGGRGARHRDFPVRVDGLHTGRRDDHRQRNLLPHHRCRQVAFGRRPDHVRGETEFAERLHVVGDGHPFFAGGDQRGVRRLRQSLFRPLLGDGDGFEPDVTSHGSDRAFVAEAGRGAGGQGQRHRSGRAPACEWSPDGRGLSRWRANAGAP